MIVTTPAVTSSGLIIAGTQHIDQSIAATNGTLFALHAATGRLAWATPIACAVLTAAVIGSGDLLFIGVYAGDGVGNGGVAAYHTESGILAWRFSTNEAVWAAPIMDAGGSLYVSGMDGSMWALAPPPPAPSALPSPVPPSAGTGLSPGTIEALAAGGGVAVGLLALAALVFATRAWRTAAKGGLDLAGPEAYRELDAMESIQ